MGVKKQLYGHGDPLLMAVVAGLEETLSTFQEEKPLGGIRGVGERTFSKGDSLLKETERYHEAHDHHEVIKLASFLRRSKENSLFDPSSQALFDPILEEYILPHSLLVELKAFEEDIADRVGLREDKLKRRKIGSLFSSRSGAMYDPVLQEYILPDTSMLELKILKDDMIKKHQLFTEMNMRKEHNLKSYELFCDPLVYSYRMRDLLWEGSSQIDMATPEVIRKMTPDEATLSKYRKMNRGDDLLKASMNYQKELVSTTE